MDYLDAVIALNDYTEHRFGLGPLMDQDAEGEKTRKKAYNLMKRTYPKHPDLHAIYMALLLDG